MVGQFVSILLQCPHSLKDSGGNVKFDSSVLPYKSANISFTVSCKTARSNRTRCMLDGELIEVTLQRARGRVDCPGGIANFQSTRDGDRRAIGLKKIA